MICARRIFVQFVCGLISALVAINVAANMTAQEALEILSNPSSWPLDSVKQAADLIREELFGRAKAGDKSQSIFSEERVKPALVKGLQLYGDVDKYSVLINLAPSVGEFPDLNLAVARTVSPDLTRITSIAIAYLAQRYWLQALGPGEVNSLISVLAIGSPEDVAGAVAVLQKVTHKKFTEVTEWVGWWRQNAGELSILDAAFAAVSDRELPEDQRIFALGQLAYRVQHGSEDERAQRSRAEDALLQKLHAEHEGLLCARAYRLLYGIYKSYSPEKASGLLLHALDIPVVRAAVFVDLRGLPDMLNAPAIRARLVKVASDLDATRMDRACAVLALAKLPPDREILLLALKVALELRVPPEKEDQPFRICIISLQELTNQQFGSDLEKWRAWIYEHYPETHREKKE
jgi:hypothetical protein